MVEVKFSLKEWQKWLSNVSFEAAANRGLLSGAARAVPILHRATDIAPPASPNGSRGASNTGRFRRSWKTMRIERGVAIFNDAPYAPVVEGGRRKGAKMPPPGALVSWVQRRAGVSKKDAKAAAFLIARAIKQRGLKPRNIQKSSLTNIRRVMLDEVTRELRLELQAKK